MNTNTLAKQYNRLTPWERLPLIFAASVRGDEVERERLSRSAPVHCHRLPDYFGLAEGLQLLAVSHVIQLLELAGEYKHVSGQLEGAAWFAKSKKRKPMQNELLGLVGMLAYAFTVHVDAWNRLCADLKVDAEMLLRGTPGWQRVSQIAPAARLMSVSPEEATVWLAKHGDDKGQAITVDDVVASMQEFLNQRADWWGLLGSVQGPTPPSS